MAVAIKNRFSGEVICAGETIRGAAIENRANLRDANLRGADLSCADLRGADLSCADLRGADLGDAYLSGANLTGAYLRDANLTGAYLRGAYLGDANLSDATLGGANLRGAYLRDANLSGANLSRANLGGANLRGANLGEGSCRAKISFQSHDLIAEILRRAAGDDVEKLKIAGFILLCREKCWREFLAIRDPLTDWALDVLRPWAEGDEDAPDVLKTKE